MRAFSLGFTVEDSIVLPEGLDVSTRRLKVEKGRTAQIFTYWFKVGDSFTSNYWRQQGRIAFNSISGQPASSALIRISSTVKAGDDEGAITRIKEFGRLIIPQLQHYLP